VNSCQKYTPAQLRYLARAADLRDRLTDKALAARFGRSRASVSRAIKNGRRKAREEKLT
jgi:hypothetical protein